MGSAWAGSSNGVRWRLELERNRLLPGRLVGGRVTVTAEHALVARGLVVTLRGEEHWRYDPWSAIVAPATELTGERTIEITGTLGDAALPTVELPHGRASAQVHVILAKSMARDPHLVRDVAIATTSEL